MSIILAIEPDRRRAAQLTGMARMHLKAELLVAANASEAVKELDGRIPDVLLTAPLLPSQEETAIGDYLRQLGPAAGHVQTLTIPLLATGAGERDRPVLSAFRRGKPQRSEAEGCDPAVFAEQITEYLREARERRAAPSMVEVTPAVEPGSEPVPYTRALTKPEGVSRLLATLFPADDYRDRPTNLFAAEPTVLPTSVERSTLIPDRTIPEPVEPEYVPTYQFEDMSPTPSFAVPETEFRELPPRPTPVSDSFALPAPLDTPSPLHMPPVGFTDTEPLEVVAPQKRGRKAAASQDEWRFFDPSQCGFPALIAKLDEIAARDSDN